ncbi:hypothetical protein MSAN_01126300 [Mycena sanguinolenta]|uniref:Uncharacterized protein n=1 Tax=Mycena sanguinolenta TaxID=230812 RepID=A0A8H6YKY1_9AGAR|nr:hypothetical protein MSAN_01126300 [Mycena sanguinolenta]
MPGITVLLSNLATPILESFFYGLTVLLFISTVYFLSTRRTLARQTAKYHLTSLVFVGLATLFLTVTAHWSIVVYQAFFAFSHLGKAAITFYRDVAQPSQVAKVFVFFVAVTLGDALVDIKTYRLWIIWQRKKKVVIFPIVTLILFAASFVGLIKLVTDNSSLSESDSRKKESENKFENQIGFADLTLPWEAAGSMLSLLANLYSTGLIGFRFWKVASPSKSSLKWFLSILIESAALQTIWSLICIVTALLQSPAVSIAVDNFPAIIAISNTLIHARVGLGWAEGPPGLQIKNNGNSPGNAVWYVVTFRIPLPAVGLRSKLF